MREPRKKLHIRLTVMYTCFALVVGVFISAFGYFLMLRVAVDGYSEKAMQAAALAASYVDGDAVAHYVRLGETDEAYERLHRELNQIKAGMELTYLYVFLPGSASFTYVVEAQVAQDDPAYIAKLGDVFEYGDWEYRHLVPDVEAARPSREGLVSMENPFFGVGVSSWVPVLDSRGELAAMVEADIHLDQMLSSIRSYLALMLAVYVALIVVMVLVQSMTVRRMITRPLGRLTERTLRFAAEGELSDFADDIRTGDELQTLSEAFDQMARDIAHYADERADLAAVQQQVATELQVAADIQSSMLPEELSGFAGGKYLDIQGRLLPSRNMGGHFYDYFALDEHRVGMVLCGMSGTGIPAAMLLVVVRTIIKSQFSGERSLADSMGEINRQVYDAMKVRQPISAFVGVMDTRTGQVCYINAGYNPPVVMRRGEPYLLLAGEASIPLGVERNVNYREVKQEMRQGSRVLFYSDGVVGALNGAGLAYGTERLRDCLNQSRGELPDGEEMMDRVIRSIQDFTGREVPEHDLLLLTLEYRRGNRELARTVLGADTARVEELKHFLRDQMEVNGIRGKDYARLLVCAEESFFLCCRFGTGARVEVEWFVPAPGQVELRFFSDFAGGNPLSEQAGGPVRDAVAFLRSHTRRLELVQMGGRRALVMEMAGESMTEQTPAAAAAR